MSDTVKAVDVDMINGWVTKSDGPVALRLKQKLLPVEESGIIFPPTYADIGYNIDTLSIDTLSDGMCKGERVLRVATIDSVGSQANRLEPIFKSDSKNPEDWVVPQIQIVIREEACGECEACKSTEPGGQKKPKKNACTQRREVMRSLLDMAHRAADAVVRSSPDLVTLLDLAFSKLQQGDAGPLCAIAPTSLVFGVWDSRGDSGEKRPRLVRSIIRAWDIEPLHAAAQFNSVWKLLDEDDQNELKNAVKGGKKDDKLSSAGLADTPATFRKVSAKAANEMKEFVKGSPNPERRVLGGVLVRDRIEREVMINLVALRGLCGKDDTESAAIRKYLLGLSLMVATADIELFLREGCLLRFADDGDQWYQVPRRGEPAPISLDPTAVKNYARAAANHFRSKWPEVFHGKWPQDSQQPALKYKFSVSKAKDLLAKKTAEEESPPEQP